MKWVYAYWWMGNNFGDTLTPYLIEKLSGKRAVWTFPVSGKDAYAITGSILGFHAVDHCIVWGCGIMSETDHLFGAKKLCAVRGVKSRNRLLALGHECPPVYGDPGLLLPRIYRPKVKPQYRLGIIPHWEDITQAYEFYGDREDVLIINVTDPVERVVDDVCKCKGIASSSLHGLVVADAYGIPNVWIEFSKKVAGSPTKFIDYWSGIGLEPLPMMDVRERPPVEEMIGRILYRPIRNNLDNLMRACPFL